MQARGSKGQLLADFESTFGTNPATPSGIRLPFNSSGLQSKQNMVDSSVIRGNRNPSPPALGNIDVSGPVVVPVDKNGIGYWLKGLFGAPITTGSGPYIHTFKPGDNQPSMVLEQGFTDIGVYNLYNGCKISKFSMSLGGDGELTASIDVMGAKETIGEASFDETPTDISLERFNNFQAAVKEGGAAIANLTKVDFAIDCGLDGEQYCIGGKGFRGDIPEGVLVINGTITGLFENKTLLDKAINGTETSLEITLSSGTHSLKFVFPELIYERNTPGIDGPKGVSISLPFRAYYDNAVEQAAIVAILTNTVQSYA